MCVEREHGACAVLDVQERFGDGEFFLHHRQRVHVLAVIPEGAYPEVAEAGQGVGDGAAVQTLVGQEDDEAQLPPLQAQFAEAL